MWLVGGGGVWTRSVLGMYSSNSDCAGLLLFLYDAVISQANSD